MMTRSFCVLLFISLISNYQDAKAQGKAYEDGYYKLIDYLMLFPYQFLGKTDFEIAAMKDPPINPNMPVSKEYWRIDPVKVEPPNGIVDNMIEIKTGYTPVWVDIHARTKLACSFHVMSSMNIDFYKLKAFMESKGAKFNREGYSQVFKDQHNGREFMVYLVLARDNYALLYFIPVKVENDVAVPIYREE